MNTHPSIRMRNYTMLVAGIYICAILLFCNVIESYGQTDSIDKSGQANISQIYTYRYLVTRYDSVVVGCMFGEMFITKPDGSQDSLQIEWINSFSPCVQPSSLDSTEAFINSNTQSKPFHITESTELSLFKMIFMRYEDDSANYSVPDTTVWTIELWDQATKKKLATIDSVGICKAINIAPSQFPTTFGFFSSDSWETFSISLGTYADTGIDSVYLLLKSKNWDQPSKEYCSLHDEWAKNRKFSERVNNSERTESDAESISEQIKLFSYPNPSRISGTTYLKISLPNEQRIAVSIYDKTGKQISSVFTGFKTAGRHVFPYHPGKLRPGTYILRVHGEAGSVLATHEIELTE